jgi:methyl-accepting chemotaxis protein
VVEENSASTEQMAAQRSEVSTTIHGIAAIAEEQSASMEEVSASAEEMSAQIEQISAQVQTLTTTADEMLRLAGRFRLDATEADQVTVPHNVIPLRCSA